MFNAHGETLKNRDADIKELEQLCVFTDISDCCIEENTTFSEIADEPWKEEISREQEGVAVNESDIEGNSPKPELQPFKAEEMITAISHLGLLFMDETDQRK